MTQMTEHWQDRLELPAATRHHFVFAWETGTYFIA